MENLQGKTAFITGGASGIGLGIAKAAGKAGMKLVIADIRQSVVDETVKYFEGEGVPVLGLQLDITDRESFVRAADSAEARFGNIHLLVNNAGIGVNGKPLWGYTYKDIDFMVSVNITGILNGIVTIVPRMLAHGEEGHVLSTASMNGLAVFAGTGLYSATKQAVVGMMETLADDLCGTKIGASAFCPGPIMTNLGQTTDEVRPEALRNEGERKPGGPPPLKPGVKIPDFGKFMMTIEECGERVIRGVRRGDLYITTHAIFREGVRARAEAMVRAFPLDPVDQELFEDLKAFGHQVYNPVYDTQKQVPPFEK
ncbi:MAG: SDR family NAD(P)-dependent oxidoreductase [Oscillospiraceae bacterium]|jgi:NAD(P)-dependent dehydrogenase (short-subunit alcohol dehydrogenase family)|nr:SDR family NAD(P)-dependent oxidoreductase [Oscillospiraceae bacterium]